VTEKPDSPTVPTDPSQPPATPGSTAAPGVVRLARIVRLPSPGATAVLAGAMLALGVAVGAAIGPAPAPSFAGGSLIRTLLPALAAPATGTASRSTTQGVQQPAVIPQATPAPGRATNNGASTKSSQARVTAGAPETSSTQNTPTPSSSTPTSTGGGGPTRALPPVTHVWLIELSGTSFADALAQPSAAPYIDGQAITSGTLLSGWSALDASAFASDAALIASTPPQLLETIVQPPCPESAAGAGCVAGTPGGLTAADEFLKATVPTITPTAAYRTNGLIVVTFGSVVSATESGLPSGASNATLTSEPPAGVLLISPFASAGTRPTATFNPTSPRQSLEKLLHQ